MNVLKLFQAKVSVFKQVILVHSSTEGTRKTLIYEAEKTVLWSFFEKRGPLHESTVPRFVYLRNAANVLREQIPESLYEECFIALM